MALALGLILLLLLLVGGTVLAPWHIRAEGQTTPPSFRADLRLWGGWAPAIPLSRPGNRAKPKKPRRKPRKSTKRNGVGKALKLRGVARLLRELLSAFRVQDLRITGRIGLDDPAETGALWGRLTPVIYGLGGPARQIAITPDFGGAVLDLRARVTLVIRPTRLLQAGVRFGWANRRLVMDGAAS